MTYLLTEISPAFKKRVDDLRAFIRAQTLYKTSLERALDSLQGDLDYIDVLLDVLLECQRLIMIHDAGLHNDSAFFEYYNSRELRGWHKQKSPPVDYSLIEGLAAKVYNMEHGQNDFGLVQAGEHVRGVIESLVNRLISEHEDFDIVFTDSVFRATLMNAADENGIHAMAARTLSQWEPVTKRMVVVPGLPIEDPPEIDRDKEKLHQKLIKSIRERSMAGEIHSTLTIIPTENDAEFDNFLYEDYLKTFFEMCDQPWKQIEAAQAILIQKLEGGDHLRFTNNDGTDVEMSIKGMTFANSVIARNIPGAEVFSAPLINSVNGKIVAKGTFTTKDSIKGRVVDITLNIKDGEVIEYDAAEGKEALKKAIETDAGSRFIGEVGIGTNSHLKRPVNIITMVEKIGGSFHLALGDSYSATEYMGKPVKFDNGNRSLLHWDITTMLYGKEGRIYLDGEVISKDGLFLDPALDVLNKGWEAIPVKERPDYWKMYDFKRKHN